MVPGHILGAAAITALGCGRGHGHHGHTEAPKGYHGPGLAPAEPTDSNCRSTLKKSKEHKQALEMNKIQFSWICNIKCKRMRYILYLYFFCSWCVVAHAATKQQIPVSCEQHHRHSRDLAHRYIPLHSLMSRYRKRCRGSLQRHKLANCSGSAKKTWQERHRGWGGTPLTP